MTHPGKAIEDWRAIVHLRLERWLEAKKAHDPAAESLRMSLEVAKKRLEAAIKYSDKPLPTSGTARPTAW